MSRLAGLFTGIILVATGLADVLIILYNAAGGFQRGGPMGMGRGMMGDMMKNTEDIERKTMFSSNGEKIFFRGIRLKGRVH